ncbi:MAG: hypothetical protein ABI587_12605 [Gemmatimonadales bacterium]
MAPNAIGRLLAVATLVGLAACGKKPEVPAVDMAELRARRDSLHQVAVKDSVARVRFATCSDSVLAVVQKTPAGKKRLASAPAGLIQPEVLAGCGKPPAAPAAVAMKDTTAKPAAPGAKPDTTKKMVATPAPAPATKPGLTPQQQQVMRADSLRLAREKVRTDSLRQVAVKMREDSLVRAKADSVRADSIRLARETEVSRETFTYAGGARDPFQSLISTDRVGPEFNDLLLVGVYLDLRRAGNSVAVLRDKANQKRYKLRVGDRLGRLKVAQIRQTDVVFTVEDIGFERQETLSLRKKQPEETP